MRNQDTANISRHGIFVLVSAIATLIVAVADTASAKSLYIIADKDRDPTPVHAYDVAPNGTLTFQAEYNIPRRKYGAVGIAINADGKYLFITYEHSNVIQLVDHRTMIGKGTVTAPGAKNLAGVVYDHDKRLLYCVDRSTSSLYAYEWDPNALILTPVTGSPFVLEGATAFGIALDEINDLLYVANYSTSIFVYRTSDWSMIATIPVRRRAISVAVDAENGFVYYGAGYAEEPPNFYLSRYNLANGTEMEVRVEPDAGVMGLDVDTATGLVYTSTGRDNHEGGDNIRVYNHLLTQVDMVALGGRRAVTDLVVPSGQASYNPLGLRKSIVDPLEQVSVGNTITYNICFNTDEIYVTLTNVSIVDTLADEVDFVTADGDGTFGQYDPNTHTYTWFYPSVAPGSAICLELVVQVSGRAGPGATIRNSVTIDSDQTPPTTTSTDIGVEDYVAMPLNLSKNLIGGLNYVDIGGTFAYQICFDNNDNEFTVSNVSIVDTLSEEVTLVTADGDGVFGQYDPNTHTYTWSYATLQPGEAGCLELVVQVNHDTEPNITITNDVIINSDQTPSAMASADVITREVIRGPLNLSKDIVWGGGNEAECIGIGDTITYSICVDNNDNDQAVYDLSIVDTLPEEVRFITADGDRVFGQYDPNTHTYTWSYPSLQPGSSTCLDLVVQVDDATEPATIITNLVAIDGNEAPPITTTVHVATCELDPLEAELRIVKVSVVQRRRLKDIMVIMRLPQGVNTGDIKGEPLVLTPGLVAARYQHVYSSGNRAKVIALFEGAGLLEAVPGYGPVNVTVAGKLKTGQPFYGQAVMHLSRLLGLGPRLR